MHDIGRVVKRSFHAVDYIANSDQPANDADEASGTHESCDENLPIAEESSSDVDR